MHVIFKLSSDQENRAMGVQENVSQELPGGLNMNWAGNLLGYLAINVDVLLSLKGGDMIFSGTRDGMQAAIPTILKILDTSTPNLSTEIHCDEETVVVGGINIPAEWCAGWEGIVSHLDLNVLTLDVIQKTVVQFSKGSDTPSLWILCHLQRLIKKREEMSQTGTSVRCQAGTDSNLNERRKIKRLRYRFQHELHRLSKGVDAGLLDKWYETEGIVLGYSTIAIN